MSLLIFNELNQSLNILLYQKYERIVHGDCLRLGADGKAINLVVLEVNAFI